MFTHLLYTLCCVDKSKRVVALINKQKNKNLKSIISRCLKPFELSYNY